MSYSIRIHTDNSVYRLIAKQELHCKTIDLWNFISSPKNLCLITPENLKFKVLSAHIGNKIINGMEIKYEVSPFAGYSTYWTSSIQGVVKRKEFTDIQIEGPFALWRHQHIIEDLGKNHLIMHDHIDFELPFGKLGKLLGEVPVKKRLLQIFEYRREKLDLFFNSPNKLAPLATPASL